MGFHPVSTASAIPAASAPSAQTDLSSAVPFPSASSKSRSVVSS